MRALRRRLRHWVALWLVLQTTSLTAFVPRDCCKAHHPDRQEAPACHKKAATSHAEHRPTCSMRAECQGPMAVLAALLSNHGIVPEAISLQPELSATRATAGVREHPIRRLISPDSPPPRA
jgi:hypothetical protein